ncbi:hypothetical protein GCM10007940_46950 [Portibacter lacus]|uniref:Uncharacterized protein n=2 Tax=Portibacter lacus TaxID=1099794 RepID=A0AA37SUN0_9BACT|nr:hypothetical protein GCM10007940_46950 [Portibacter lacus]
MSILFSSCLTDLRTKSLRSPELYTPEMHEQGVEILKRYAKVSGEDKWKTINSYQIYFNDDFFGLMGGLAQPFKNKRNKFKLNYYTQENAGTLEFLNGKKEGQVWGYNEGSSYIKETINAKPIDKDKKGIKFWLPTYQYFIEFPFRISNADIIYFVGEDKYGLNVYDKVLVSWKQAAPQRKIDQYLLWLNKDTGLVDILQYTIRDQGAIFKGTAFIEEHTNYNGIVIPALFRVYLKKSGRRPLHIMRPHHFTATDFIVE